MTTPITKEKTLYQLVAEQSERGFQSLEVCYQLEKSQRAFAKPVQSICSNMRAAIIQWTNNQKKTKIAPICSNNEELYTLCVRIKQFYTGIFGAANSSKADAEALKKAETAIISYRDYKGKNDESFHKQYLDLLNVTEFPNLKSLLNMPRAKL